MCGIVGIANGQGVRREALDDVRRMAGVIRHRGPDDEGFHASPGGEAILGMRRLSIIDLAGGHQPIANEDGTVWVVCNGEIYNFKSLRAGLEARGHRFRTGSDVECIVHLYEEHGDDFLRHLSGMYGLALWDERRRRLVLARDRLGQKPVYYHDESGHLAFASEVKALLALPGIRAELDPAALREHLFMGFCTAPRTVFRGIRKLPPATALVWEQGRTRLWQYWQLPATVRHDLDEGAWVEQIRVELRRAVAEHMVADVPIGAFLSGGIDSSAIVAMMAEHGNQPVNTYSIGYEGSAAARTFDELPYAAFMADAVSARHHEVRATPDAAALLPRLMWHTEEPLSDSAVFTAYLLAKRAGEDVKVILTGIGGDELFAGYRRYLGGFVERRMRMIPSWVQRGIVQPIADAIPAGRETRIHDLGRYARRVVRGAGLPWREQYRLYMQVCDAETLESLLTVGASESRQFDRVLQKESSDDELLRLLHIDASTQLPEDLLLLADKVAMAASIECRSPFLDERLVELAAVIPAAVKVQGGASKSLFKRAMTGIVPEKIIGRGKRGFGAPVGAWFKSDLREFRDTLLGRTVVESRGLLQWKAVQKLISDHDTGREDYSDLLLSLVNLELWCRLFLDGRSHSDVGDEVHDLVRAA